MNNQLIWKNIAGFEGLYEVSNTGIVRSTLRKVADKRGVQRSLQPKIILPRLDRGGYYTVRLSKEGRTTTHYMHRILGKAFIANPENLPCINHINGCKTDNRLQNLEWLSRSHNALHAFKTGLSKVPQKSMKQVIDTRTGMLYPSIRHAATSLRIPYSTCKNYLNGNRQNATSLRVFRSGPVAVSNG